MHKVAAIIVTYNAIPWLQKCLDHVFASVYPLTVYCCDNGSADETLAVLQEAGNKINLIAAGKNLGFGAANNLCIKKAYDDGADFFLLINQDVYIEKDTVNILMDTLLQHSNTALVSPLHLNGEGNAFDKNFLQHLTAAGNKDFVNDLYFARQQNTYEVSYINAACWMLSRNTIEKIGGFDPLFFHYGEDDNYCQRILFHGLKIIVTTAASIRHQRDDRDGDIRKEYMQDKDHRSWLIKVSNVFNTTNDLSLKQLKHAYWRCMLSSMAAGKMEQLAGCRKAFITKKETLKKAAEHKKINRQQGMHWLAADKTVLL